jgi:Tol biopolymer transport system component
VNTNEAERSHRRRHRRAGKSGAAVILVATVLLYVGSRYGGQPTPAPLSGLRWTDQTPSWSPDGRTVVFASNRAHPKGGIDQLYKMSANGAGVRRLTWGGDDAREPSFSPDGRRIVYAGNVLDSSRDFTNASGIFTISANGTDVRFLTPGLLGAAYQPAWSPNGRWIAFLDDTAPNAAGADPIDLYVMRPDGSDRRPLAINVDGWSFSWSPDSTEIAVGGGRGDRVVHVSVNAAKPIWLANGPRTVITDIVWSPDGSKIAYARGPIVVNSCFCDADGSDVDPRHLWVLDLRNHEQRRLRPVINSGSVDSFATTITWLKRPGSTIAVFDGDRIRIVGVDGHSRGSLKTANWGQLSAGSASPDGSKLVLVDGPSSSYDSGIYIAAIDSQSLRQLTQRDKR